MARSDSCLARIGAGVAIGGAVGGAVVFRTSSAGVGYEINIMELMGMFPPFLCRCCVWDLCRYQIEGPWAAEDQTHRTGHCWQRCGIRAFPGSWELDTLWEKLLDHVKLPLVLLGFKGLSCLR
uniref:Uncharacterized protein n=1 Tax=Triticum urartu TaxID=4572 RepID=A0A8R7JYE7_TRIUA